MYSIIIPCYKSSETIQRVVECTIEEMKNLGKTELEFVLVNDCSPDNRKTWRKLNEIADKYPFVKIIWNLKKFLDKCRAKIIKSVL